MKTYEFQVYCNDEPVAGASGPDRERALFEAINYAHQYADDGPVFIEQVTRKVISRFPRTEPKP